MARAMIVYNPDSGQGQSKATADALNEKIRHHYETITMKETASGGDVSRFSKEAAEKKYDALFLLGGDGTVNLAVNGLADVKDSPAIGVIPTGTINNFARMLNIPMNPEQAIEALANAEILQTDIGKFNDTYFVSTVSSGPIPDMAKNVSSEEKDRLGPIAYIKEGVEGLNDEDTMSIELVLDGEIVEEEVSFVLVTTGNSVFGWHNFFPEATLEDGEINVMALKQTTAGEKISLLPELLSDDGEYSELLLSGQYKNISIKPLSKETLETTVDGNDGPDLPGEITVGRQLPFFVVKEEQI